MGFFLRLHTGPELSDGLYDIGQSMVTSPDGMGIIIVGGHGHPHGNQILDSRFDGS